METVEIKLYSFDELSKDAQEKAIAEHESFLLEIGQECENEDGELVTEYSETINRDDVIDSIDANDYLFFSDGEFAHITHYCSKHEKAGITEFHFHGQTVKI